MDFTLKKIENQQAHLEDKNGKILKCEQSLLPENAQIGEKFFISFSREPDNSAKKILNEILNTEN